MKTPNNPMSNHKLHKINRVINHNKIANSNKVMKILKTDKKRIVIR